MTTGEENLIRFAVWISANWHLSLRLQLSPSPSQRTTVARTHEHSGRKLGGKKRKHEGVQGSSPASKMSSRSTDSGTVSVAEVDINGKYIRLKNHTETVRLRLDSGFVSVLTSWYYELGLSAFRKIQFKRI